MKGYINILDWLKTHDLPQEFEVLDETQLAELLRRFYGEVNSKNGKPYSKSAVIGIRAGFNRYLQGPPHNKSVNIVSGKSFMAANKVFTGRIRLNKAAGLDVSKHKTAVAPGDLKRIYDTRILSNDNSTSLLHKIFFEISLHFGRRGREGLATLKKQDFVFCRDDQNPDSEFATICFNETTKKNHGVENKQSNKEQRMYSQPGDPKCPITSLKLYLSKLSQEDDAFFQIPRKPQTESFESMSIWYKRKLDKNSIENMMQTISKLGGLTKIYTNHSIRATACTVLAHNDIAPNDIINVTGHKDPNSLIPYVATSSNQKRKQMSEILHRYGKFSSPVISSVHNSASRFSLVGDAPLNLLENANISGGNVTININKK